MNSGEILKIVLAVASVLITAITFYGGIKEGKESFKKLNEHLDEKEKEAKDKEYQSHAAHQ